MTPPAEWGRREARFTPSHGQTAVGTALCAAMGIVALLIAAFGTMFDAVNRVCAVILAGIMAGMGRWIWSHRGWCLEIYEGGVIQTEEGIAWTNVRSVVETRLTGGFGDTRIRVTLQGSGGDLVVNPINTRSRTKALDRLVEAARSRGIPLRVEWEESS